MSGHNAFVNSGFNAFIDTGYNARGGLLPDIFIAATGGLGLRVMRWSVETRTTVWSEEYSVAATGGRIALEVADDALYLATRTTSPDPTILKIDRDDGTLLASARPSITWTDPTFGASTANRMLGMALNQDGEIWVQLGVEGVNERATNAVYDRSFNLIAHSDAFTTVTERLDFFEMWPYLTCDPGGRVTWAARDTSATGRQWIMSAGTLVPSQLRGGFERVYTSVIYGQAASEGFARQFNDQTLDFSHEWYIIEGGAGAWQSDEWGNSNTNVAIEDIAVSGAHGTQHRAWFAYGNRAWYVRDAATQTLADLSSLLTPTGTASQILTLGPTGPVLLSYIASGGAGYHLALLNASLTAATWVQLGPISDRLPTIRVDLPGQGMHDPASYPRH